MYRVYRSSSASVGFAFLVALVLCLFMPMQAQAQRNLPISFLIFDGLFSSQDGTVYAAGGFADTRVFRIDNTGRTTVVSDQLSGPIDIAEDAEGNLYVTNFNTASVSKITADGQVSHFADVNPFPSGIVADAAGNFYVTHFGEADPATGLGTGNSIVKVTADGSTSVFTEGGLLSAPVGIDIDESNNLYVGNLHNGELIKIDSNGQQELLVDLTGDEINFAIGHVEYVNGFVFATGIQDHALFRINPRNGRVRSRDIEQRVRFPNGLSYNAQAGALYIADAFLSNPALTKITSRRLQYAW